MRYVFLILFLWNYVCVAQNFEYKDIPSDYIKDKLIINTNSFVDITSYLPGNYVKDGSVDYTVHLQEALLKNEKILMPNFPVLISDVGLDIMNNSVIFFQNNSKLVLKPSSKGSYQILRIKDKENIKIYNANIIGDRDYHTGNKGEWGMGISIIGSENIEIKNFNITNCWGDGIYIGHGKSSSNKIVIADGIIDNNRRNGISVISVNNLVIRNVIVSNTNGTNPNTGIDIEPNYSYNILKNIKIQDVTTFNNKINGILIHLAELPGNKKNSVGIDIINHKDYFSSRPIRISGALKKDKNSIVPLSGNINLVNFRSFNNEYEPAINENHFFPKIKVLRSIFTGELNKKKWKKTY